MKIRNRMWAMGLAAAVAAAAGACSSAQAKAEQAAAEPNVVTVVAHDYAFEAPAEIPAGLTTLRLVNRGQTLHHATLVKLDEGKTLQDLFAAMQGGGAPPAWMHEMGGPNAPDPGAEANATLVLEPGNYAFLCFVDMPGGVPHVMRGMVKPLRVTGPAPAAAAVPAGDVVMKLDDYSFTLSTPLTAGTRTIRVENAGRQAHEVELIRLAPGKTMQDLQAWMQAPNGPPPASAIGGIAGMRAGEVQSFTASITPGEYVLICFLPDAGDRKPHFMHGMVQTITVS